MNRDKMISWKELKGGHILLHGNHIFKYNSLVMFHLIKGRPIAEVYIYAAEGPSGSWLKVDWEGFIEAMEEEVAGYVEMLRPSREKAAMMQNRAKTGF